MHGAEKLVFTKKLIWYLFKFAFRITVFVCVLVAYLVHKEILVSFMTHEFTFGISEYGISALHVMWAAFMVMMLRHLIPLKSMTMALLKAAPENYHPVDHVNELEMLRFVQDMNRKAWIVMLTWLCMNAFWGLLYLLNVIDSADLLMLSVFYFLCDYICILLFCPFQTFIMKNRCCVNCRIYDWGHFMMFTPMLFIRNFFSWSLFFTSLVVLIHWEYVYATHPERFWYGTNKTLQCRNCKDRTCQIKKRVSGTVGEKE